MKYVLFFCVTSKLLLHLQRSSKWGTDILNERAFLDIILSWNLDNSVTQG